MTKKSENKIYKNIETKIQEQKFKKWVQNPKMKISKNQEQKLQKSENNK
jgi:hypothetical protein